MTNSNIIITPDDFGLDFIEEIIDTPYKSNQISVIEKTNDYYPEFKEYVETNQDHDNPAQAYVDSLQSKLSQVTMTSLLNNISRILGFQNLLYCPWGMLNKRAVEYVIRKLREKSLSPSTINLYLNAMRQTAEYASDLEIMEPAELRRIKRIKQERGFRCSHGREVTSCELKKLILTCMSTPQTNKDMRDAAIICIMRGCGLRRSEVVGLQIGSFDPSTRTLSVVGKGNKERRLRVPKKVFPFIERWIEYRLKTHAFNEDPLFCGVHRSGGLINRDLTSKGIEKILKTRIKSAGVDDFSPHDLRRTFCTGLLSSGVDMSDVQKLMGHSDMKTTQRYDMRSRDRLLDISDNIDW